MGGGKKAEGRGGLRGFDGKGSNENEIRRIYHMDGLGIPGVWRVRYGNGAIQWYRSLALAHRLKELKSLLFETSTLHPKLRHPPVVCKGYNY